MFRHHRESSSSSRRANNHQHISAMLYELIGVVCSGAFVLTTHHTNPYPRSVPAAASTRSKSTLPSRPPCTPPPSHTPNAVPFQNRAHSRQPSPHRRRRCPRHHKLGHFPPAQTRPQAGRNLPQRPLLHHALRLERKDTARCQEDAWSGSEDDSLLDGEGWVEVR
jgi:hypothetical protein